MGIIKRKTRSNNKVKWPSCVITSDDQISPPSLVCKQNSSHLTLFAWVFFSTVLPWEFIYVKLRNFVF